MEIVKYPNPILNKVCSPVTVFNVELHKLLDQMHDVMLNAKGLGLAANQVGLDMRMFVMRLQSGEKLDIINPSYEVSDENKANISEGCLSAPGEFDIVQERAQNIKMVYNDRDGNLKNINLTGIDAVCAQHEIDHLNGIFFFSKLDLTRQRRRALERKWGKV